MSKSISARGLDLPQSLMREFSRRTEVQDHFATTRPVRSSVVSDYRLIVSGGIYTFGKGAPSFTIPSSRRDPPPGENHPGPGHYDPQSPKDNHVKPRIGSSRQSYEREPVTSCVDYVYQPSFPERKAFTIGNRDKFEFFQPSVSPGPKYAPPSALDLEHSHIIASRHEHAKKDEVPGPGKYEPNFLLPKGPMFTVKGPKNRHDWLTGGSEVTPGPGEYEPKEAVDKTIGACIGGHGKNVRARTSIGTRGSDLLAVDKVIVRLNRVGGDHEETKRYVAMHPDLKRTVKDIMDTVLELKPDDPVAFIREGYMKIRKQMEEENPKKEEDTEWMTGIDDIKLDDEEEMRHAIARKIAKISLD